jgi:nanoRNase/pAp phosphatase (c-di-AMP/oligoRNAs hydrolase)
VERVQGARIMAITSEQGGAGFTERSTPSGASVRLAPAAGAPRGRASELLTALRAHGGGRHVVVIRGYPDPDSLASAWAHARLAASVGIECDIAHMPVVSRAENRAMVNLLDMPLVRIAAADDLSRYAALSLVDANAIELPRAAGLPCASIVDHHAIGGPIDAEYVDIRPDIGSTSAIYAQYLLDGPARVLDDGALGGRLATALAYGIRSDTDDLLRATPADLHALGDILGWVDGEILAELSRFSIPASAMRILRRALEAVQIEGTWAFAGVGAVRPQDRDAIGQAADFLVRREGVRTVIVYGVVDGWIDGSLRTTDATIDPAAWLRDAFGIGPGGLPYGGGRRGKGGFQLPLGPIAACPNAGALWQVVRDTMEDTLRRRIGSSRAEEEEDRALREANGP